MWSLTDKMSFSPSSHPSDLKCTSGQKTALWKRSTRNQRAQMTLAQGCLVTHYTQGGGLWSGCMTSPRFTLMISVFCIGCTLVRVPNHMQRVKGHCKWWWISFHWIMAGCEKKKGESQQKGCKALTNIVAAMAVQGLCSKQAKIGMATLPTTKFWHRPIEPWIFSITIIQMISMHFFMIMQRLTQHASQMHFPLSTWLSNPPRMWPPTSCAQSKTLMALYKKFGCKTVSLLIIHCNRSIFQIATHRLAYLKACTWLSRSALRDRKSVV